MKVLLAGASGAIGMPLIRRLHAAGHDVLAVHRSPEKRARLAAAGTTPIEVDVLHAPALLQALHGQRVDAVICELSSLKKTPMVHKDMTATNILRTEGTRNLIAAARQLGARRFVTQSMVFGYGYGDWRGRVLTETDPFGPAGHGRFEEHLASMRSNEEQVLNALGLDGVALRYALLYGPAASDTVMDQLRRRTLPVVRNSGVLPWVYIDDAAAATVAALERGEPGAAYNIADNEPVSLATLMTAMSEAIGAPRPRTVPGWLLAAAPLARAGVTGGLRISSARAKTELGWTLEAPTYREGLRLLARHYARAIPSATS
jgi:nucleoside-diphosphate-sugar epimerase